MSQIQELKKSRVHVSDFQEKSEALADGDSLRKDLMERMKAKDAVLNDLKEQVSVRPSCLSNYIPDEVILD